jgi:two-component system, NarL family, nitrate/nitrite response regulator NarL
MSIRVTVAGAGEVVAAGLQAVLTPQDDLEFSEGAAAAGDADVVLYDVIGIQADGGRELWAVIATGTPVLAIGRPLRPDLAARALAHGAVGTLSTEVDPAELLAAIRAVAAGDPMPIGIHPTPAPALGDAEGLSPREVTVLSGITRGLSNDEICTELHIMPNTVKSVIRSAYRKIGVASRVQAMSWCLQHGFDPGTAESEDETG